MYRGSRETPLLPKKKKEEGKGTLHSILVMVKKRGEQPMATDSILK